METDNELENHLESVVVQVSCGYIFLWPDRLSTDPQVPGSNLGVLLVFFLIAITCRPPRPCSHLSLERRKKLCMQSIGRRSEAPYTPCGTRAPTSLGKRSKALSIRTRRAALSRRGCISLLAGTALIILWMMRDRGVSKVRSTCNVHLVSRRKYKVSSVLTLSAVGDAQCK